MVLASYSFLLTMIVIFLVQLVKPSIIAGALEIVYYSIGLAILTIMLFYVAVYTVRFFIMETIKIPGMRKNWQKYLKMASA